MRGSALIAVGVLWISSCASTGTMRHVELLPAEEIIRRIQERENSIQTIEAEGMLTVETPEQSGTMNFELQLRKRDTLWMEFSGPFGIALGTFMLTPEKFIFYSSQEKRKITGVPKPEVIARLFRISVSYDDIMRVVTGSFNRVGGDDEVLLQSISEDRYYVLHANGAASRRELWVDAEAFVTTRYAEYSRDNRPAFVGSSTRIESVDGTYMPHVVRIILPRERQSATLAYSDLRVNRAYRRGFSIPDDAEEFIIEQSH